MNNKLTRENVYEQREMKTRKRLTQLSNVQHVVKSKHPNSYILLPCERIFN